MNSKPTLQGKCKYCPPDRGHNNPMKNITTVDKPKTLQGKNHKHQWGKWATGEVVYNCLICGEPKNPEAEGKKHKIIVVPPNKKIALSDVMGITDGISNPEADWEWHTTELIYEVDGKILTERG